MYEFEILLQEEYNNYRGQRLVKLVRKGASQDTVCTFYSVLRISDYIKFFEDSFLGQGTYSYEMNFYLDPDKGQVGSLSKEVVFWVYNSSQKISEKQFWELNLGYARKILMAVEIYNHGKELIGELESVIRKIQGEV